MNPTEKAKELVDKYREVNSQYVLNGEANQNDVLDEAKECALILVEEMISSGTPNKFDNEGNEIIFYWENVKSEINEL